MKQYIIFISCIIGFNMPLQAQMDHIDTNILLQEKTLFVKDSIFIPSAMNNVWVDSGEGKLCSCQFWVHPKNQPRQLTTQQALDIADIQIKGLFDGSQMHVVRIYLDTRDYFKLKCYGKRITKKHLELFFTYKEKETMEKIVEGY